MKIIELSQCKTDLDFGPTKNWPAPLPVIVHSGQVIAGFDRFGQDKSGGDLSASGSFEAVLAAVYQNLSATEVLVLLSKLKSVPVTYDPVKLFEAFGFRLRDNYFDLAEQVRFSDADLLNWLKQKDLGFFELENIFPIPTDANAQAILKNILALSPGRTDGFKAIEILKELCSFSVDLTSLGGFTSLRDLQNGLQALRFPLRYQQISSMEAKSKKISWPKNSVTRWNFETDQPSLEVRLRIQSSNDVEKLSSVWGLISQQLQDSESNPWV